MTWATPTGEAKVTVCSGTASGSVPVPWRSSTAGDGASPVTVSWPTARPSLPGENRTDTVQLEPGPTAPFVQVSPVMSNGPVIVTEATCSGALPVSVTG